MKHRYSKSDCCGRVFRHLPRLNRAMCARLIIIANSTQSASMFWLWHLNSRAYMMETDENECYYKEFYVSPGKATALCYWPFPQKLEKQRGSCNADSHRFMFQAPPFLWL